MNLPLQLMPLPLASLEFRLTALEPIEFRDFPGFTFRSVLGLALRSLCILKNSRLDCRPCPFHRNCPYGYLFETPKAAETPLRFEAEKLPHPMVWSLSLTKSQTVRKGQSFSLFLTLIGRGVSFLSFYVYAVLKICELGIGPSRARLHLEDVVDRFSENRLYDPSTRSLIGKPIVRQLQDFNDEEKLSSARLTFLTPVQIIHHNRPEYHLTAEILIRTLLRRLSLLAAQHAQAWSLDYSAIIQSFVDSVQTADHRFQRLVFYPYSSRQQRQQVVKAVIGELTLTGDLAPFLPLLRAGEYTHIGSDTSRGFGRYELTINPF